MLKITFSLVLLTYNLIGTVDSSKAITTVTTEALFECEHSPYVEGVEIVHAERIEENDFSIENTNHKVIYSITFHDEEPELTFIHHINTSMAYLYSYIVVLTYGVILDGPCQNSTVNIAKYYHPMDLNIFSIEGLSEASAKLSLFYFVDGRCGQNITCSGELTNYFNPSLTFYDLAKLPLKRFLA